MVAVLCFAFLISQFYRASIGVLTPALMKDFVLSANLLGILGGVYFLVFAVAQIPCGILLDRYGPRRVNSLLFSLVALGATIFAFAQTPAQLIVGRSIIGLGCATCLMGTLVIFSRWLPAERFPFMVAIASGVGGSGALVATMPLAWAEDWLGWRGAILFMAAVTSLIAYLIWLVVRDYPTGANSIPVGSETLRQAAGRIGKIAQNRQLHFLLPLNTVAYGATMVLLGLWGTPYFRDVHGTTTLEASRLLMGMASGLIAGGFLFAWLAPMLCSLKNMVLFGSLSSGFMFLVIAFLPPSNPPLLMAIVCSQGVLSGYGVLIISHVRTLMPQHMMGRGLTLANLFGFGGVGCMQVLSGWVMSQYNTTGGAYPTTAYAVLFTTVGCLVLASSLVYFKTEKVNLTRDSRTHAN